MKKLDVLLIRSFIGPFVVTFFVALFVLVMQFFWLYMDELIGKGVGVFLLIELLVYMAAVLVQLALPLAILLSSIMTFGNLGENFELVAIKSSGISLLRFMKPLVILIIIMSGLAFVFANNVMPVANLKALSLLYDLRNKKPAMIIRPSQFNNDLQGYSIRVGSMDKDGKKITDVLIYDHSDMMGNNKVVMAKEGEIVPSPDKQSLIFKLRDGWQYHEGYKNGSHDYTQVRMHFDEWDKDFDLSGMKFTRSSEEGFRNANQMMNVSQLTVAIDSLKKQKERSAGTLQTYVAQYVVLETQGKPKDAVVAALASKATVPGERRYDTSFRELVPEASQKAMVQQLTNNVRNFKSLVDVMALDSRLQTENWMKYEIELHRKFTLSFACLLLFLIGAPLGAIIRKGGLGMPLVVAVTFFVIFHILNISGEKLAKSEAVKPWMGMWMSTIILLPLALWLIAKARNDSRIFTKEWYTRAAKSLVAMLPKSVLKKKPA
ncbi:MAG: LptF/LptG family permease [Taibaiella sp.]|nr:LptF/LptG family permease [Taibaiella sp.]